MDNWEELIFDELIEDKLIGLVRNTKQQSFDFEFDYLKMNNITNDGKLNLKDLVKVNASTDEVEKYKLQKGDFLFNTRNSIELVGKTAIYDFESSKALLFNNNIMRSRFKSDFDPYFINYQFQSSEFQERLEKIKSGTTSVAAIYYKSLRDIKLKFPPLPEQQRIVAKLDGLFAKIDKALSLLEANIEHTQALMGSVLDEELSNLEEICLKVKVKDVVKLSRGHNPPKKDFIYEPKEDYVRFLQIRDGTSDKNACYVPITKKLHLVTKNDLLLVAYRHVGKVFRNMEGAFNVALCKLENLDESKLNMTYMFYLVQSKYIKGELLKRSERALIPSMSVDHLKSLKIPFPDIKKQNKLALKFENVSKLSKKLIKIQTKKLNHLKALKSSLLDQAFKGEL